MHAFFTAHAADLVDVQRTVQQIVEQARSDAAFRERLRAAPVDAFSADS